MSASSPRFRIQKFRSLPSFILAFYKDWKNPRIFTRNTHHSWSILFYLYMYETYLYIIHYKSTHLFYISINFNKSISNHLFRSVDLGIFNKHLSYIFDYVCLFVKINLNYVDHKLKFFYSIIFATSWYFMIFWYLNFWSNRNYSLK